MNTIGEIACVIARRRGWSCEKLRAFVEHCAETGYDLDAPYRVIGCALAAIMRGFDIFVWQDGKEDTLNS